MKVTDKLQEPYIQSFKFYFEKELLNCLEKESICVNVVLSLIESNF